MQNQNKRKQTEQTIFSAFWKIYQGKSINQVTVKAITQEAAINRSTFYEYFADPYDVLARLEANLLPPLKPHLNGGVGYCLNVYEKNKQYFKVLLGENGDPAFGYKLQEQLTDYFAEQLGLKSPFSEELYYRFRFVSAGLVGVIQRYFEGGSKMTNTQVIDLLQEMVLAGLKMQLVDGKLSGSKTEQ